MHGIAINVSPELAHYEHIVPCGIHGRSVTSVAQELRRAGRPPRQQPRPPPLSRPLSDGSAADGENENGGSRRLLEETHGLLLRHFADVFAVELADADEGEGECYQTGECAGGAQSEAHHGRDAASRAEAVAAKAGAAAAVNGHTPLR